MNKFLAAIVAKSLRLPHEPICHLLCVNAKFQEPGMTEGGYWHRVSGFFAGKRSGVDRHIDASFGKAA
jgi:hypothetical protein